MLPHKYLTHHPWIEKTTKKNLKISRLPRVVLAVALLPELSHPEKATKLISLQIARSTDIVIEKLANFHMNDILQPTVYPTVVCSRPHCTYSGIFSPKKKLFFQLFSTFQKKKNCKSHFM